MFFYNIVQFWYGLQTGTADANENFFARFLTNQSGDVYTYGDIECAGTLRTPTIYNKTAIANLLAHTQYNNIDTEQYYVDNDEEWCKQICVYAHFRHILKRNNKDAHMHIMYCAIADMFYLHVMDHSQKQYIGNLNFICFTCI